jgi:hypothetical protein
LFKIECVLECGDHLGEGPVWDVEENGGSTPMPEPRFAG